jgi:hypothetical protein
MGHAEGPCRVTYLAPGEIEAGEACSCGFRVSRLLRECEASLSAQHWRSLSRRYGGRSGDCVSSAGRETLHRQVPANWSSSPASAGPEPAKSRHRTLSACGAFPVRLKLSAARYCRARTKRTRPARPAERVRPNRRPALRRRTGHRRNQERNDWTTSIAIKKFRRLSDWLTKKPPSIGQMKAPQGGIGPRASLTCGYTSRGSPLDAIQKPGDLWRIESRRA